MTTRADMLDRVRKALGRSTTSLPEEPLPSLDLAGVMPALAPEDYLPKFEAEWEKVAGVPYRVADRAQLKAVFEKILAGAERRSVVLSRNPLLGELHVSEILQSIEGTEVTIWSDGQGRAGTNSLPNFNQASFAAGVGITGVDLVLAESGTLVLSSLTEGAQVASLAPPVHVALYRRSQLVGSLDEVLAKLPVSSSPDRPSAGRSVVFITGTSRTADIEQILIRGVHGPREVHAVLLEDSCR